jgi:outer membrane receptor protein involved in Fe transport
MRKFLFAVLLFASANVFAQAPTGARGPRAGGQNMNIGHLYGKIVNSSTNKGVDGASLQLIASRFDTVTKKPSEYTIKALITQANGDFSFDNLPVFGNYKLRISNIGYKPVEQKVNFGLNGQRGGGEGEGGGMQQMMGMVDKDLGNIKMEADASVLADVTVTATRQMFEMGVDRKIFNVDKNLVSSGQTATEVMKSIPSLSVDIDGNVTLRNSTPQLFVDGRPTTLTMDQIPADLIDRVELITNPSAKFDASGGNAGILNIVLKKNKKVGYNGGIRAGVDSRGKVNVGGDINFRQNKINFFASGVYNQRKSKSWSTTDRTNLINPPSRVYQTSKPFNNGAFGFGRAGFDYLIDNRNTITVTGSLARGSFDNNNDQRIDSFLNGTYSAYNLVAQNSESIFRNLGAQFSYKHNFAKSGHEITADANYNASKNENSSFINTQTFTTANDPKKLAVRQQTLGDGTQNNLTIQSDYSNPISDNQKLELGVRASIRNFDNDNNQFFFDYPSGKFLLSNSISSKYKYTDKVYAAYATYSLKVKKFSYQFGLRAENSTYDGTLLGQDTAAAFKVDFPLSLFPSVFVTNKLSDKEDLQLNYSRRINRPNFFQLIPFIDYSDPQNISVGNAGLKPEFTNSFELSYNNNYKKGANFLVSTYFKHNTNLITRYQYYDANPDTAHHYSSLDSVLFNTYLNANNSITFGLELTNRMPVTKWYDMTLNFNLFNSKINISDPKLGGVSNQRTSWFVKMNNNLKIAKTYSIQLSGEYYAKTVLPSEGGRGGGGRGGGGGGGMWGGGPTATAQGYINPRYGFDIAVRKDWTWKGGNSASLTLSMNDFLRTQLFSTYSESTFLKQTSERRRDPQVARLNFSYRFGKFDVNLFKRKNTKADQGGGEMPMGQ